MSATEVKDLKKKVKKYIDEADERMVRVVYAMFEADKQADWWDEISDDERAAIKEGYSDMAQGKTTPHDEVMKKYGKWLAK